MSSKTKIGWCDSTDNIFRVKGGGFYCQKDNPDCLNCYAEGVNQNSFFGGNGLPYTRLEELPEFDIKLGLIQSWARARKPKKRFISSMTDVFGCDVVTGEEFFPRAWHFGMLDGMSAAPSQTFIVLTKRPHVALKAVEEWLAARSLDRLPSNVWLITSAGHQKAYDAKLPHVLALSKYATIVGFSCEPLWTEIDLHLSQSIDDPRNPGQKTSVGQVINWVIVGGESGSKARECKPEWIKDILLQCQAWWIPVFVKQMGEYWAKQVGIHAIDHKAEDPEHWEEFLHWQLFPQIRDDCVYRGNPYGTVAQHRVYVKEGV